MVDLLGALRSGRPRVEANGCYLGLARYIDAKGAVLRIVGHPSPPTHRSCIRNTSIPLSVDPCHAPPSPATRPTEGLETFGLAPVTRGGAIGGIELPADANLMVSQPTTERRTSLSSGGSHPRQCPTPNGL